jgi:hypothetical protein
MKHFAIVLAFVAGFLCCSAVMQSQDAKVAAWDAEHAEDTIDEVLVEIARIEGPSDYGIDALGRTPNARARKWLATLKQAQVLKKQGDELSRLTGHDVVACTDAFCGNAGCDTLRADSGWVNVKSILNKIK